MSTAVKDLLDEGHKALHDLVQSIKGHLSDVQTNTYTGIAPHPDEAQGQIMTAHQAYDECRKARVELDEFQQAAAKTRHELEAQITAARQTLEHYQKHTPATAPSRIMTAEETRPPRVYIGESQHEPAPHVTESKRRDTK